MYYTSLRDLILTVHADNLYFVHSDDVAFNLAHFGVGIGQIYFDSVSCSGTERRLIDCSRASSVSCDSGHSEDAGVRCQIEGEN